MQALQSLGSRSFSETKLALLAAPEASDGGSEAARDDIISYCDMLTAEKSGAQARTSEFGLLNSYLHLPHELALSAMRAELKWPLEQTGKFFRDVKEIRR